MEERFWTNNATPGWQTNGNAPLAPLAQLLPWTTDPFFTVDEVQEVF